MSTNKGYQISISMPGEKETLAALESVAAKIEDVARRAASAIAGIQAKTPANPWARLDAANDSLSQMRAQGSSEDELRVFRLEQVRAQRAASRADKDLAGPEDPLKKMIMQTQLKIGSWQPKVGDLVKSGLINEGKVDGFISKLGQNPAMMATVTRLAMAIPVVGAAAAAAGSFAVSSYNTFMENTRSYGNAAWRAGGFGSLGPATGLGSFAGMNPGQTADAANSLSQALQKGGYGAAWMRQRGVIDMGDLRTPDKFPNLVKALDLLRAEKDEATAATVARQLGLSDWMSIRYLNDDQYDAMKKSTMVQSSEFMQAMGAKQQANMAQLGNGWDAMKTSVGFAISSMLTGDFRPIGASIRGYFGDYAGAAKMMNESVGTGKNKDVKKAIDENTDAIVANTRTIKEGMDLQGGATGARKATMLALKGMQFDELSQGYAQSIGAFKF